MGYVICCSSTADLTEQRLDERNIPWVPFHFHMDGKEYFDDYGHSMSLSTFYRKEREGAAPTTSQVNVDEYLKFWKPFLESGSDIFHLTLSSGISGTFNSANIAAKDAREFYPERNIYIMDSLCASSGYGLFVEELADKRDEGYGLEELIKYAEELRPKINHWVFTTDLSSLIRGGRVSPMKGTVANILNICPIIKVDAEGKLTVVSRIRTRKKVIQETVKAMEKHAENRKDYSGRCYIAYSDCEEDAAALRSGVEESFPNIRGKVETFRIGTTIGSHTGAFTVALFFIGDART